MWHYTLAASALAAFFAFGLYARYFFALGIKAHPAAWGQFGDYAGGVLGTVFTFITVLLLVHSSKESAASAERSAKSAAASAEALVDLAASQGVANLRAELSRAATSIQETIFRDANVKVAFLQVGNEARHLSLMDVLEAMSEELPWQWEAAAAVHKARPLLHINVMTMLNVQASLIERYENAGTILPRRVDAAIDNVLKQQCYVHNKTLLAYIGTWRHILDRGTLDANRDSIAHILYVYWGAELTRQRMDELFQ